MKYGEFVEMVDKFVGKKNLTDRIPWFIKLARINLQRGHDFAFTRKEMTFTYPSTSGVGFVLPTDFKAFYGDNAAFVVVNGINLPLEATTEGRERRRLMATTFSTSSNQPATQAGRTRYYITPGASSPTFWTYPEQLGKEIKITYYHWLPDYASGDEEDFLLLRGYDLLLWETIKVANTYLFEEERIPFNQEAFNIALFNFTELDNQLKMSNAPIDVD